MGGTGYSYDDNGNLTNDGTYLYYYDCENRLTEVNDINDSPVASYKYDYLGRRVSKTVDSTTTKYCYDGDQVIAEYDGSDTLLRKFIYGPGIDEPICMIDVADSNTMYYYHFDGLGSVVALSDSTGSIIEQYSYDVFGEPNRVSDVNNPYMFTARRYDAETANYYYRARYYKPTIDRFLQTDPIGYYAGLNLYTYVKNNPIFNVDPQGLCGSYSFSSKTKVSSVKLVGQLIFGLGCELIKGGGGAEAVAKKVEDATNTSFSSESDCTCGSCMILYTRNSTIPFIVPLGIPLTAAGEITAKKPACIAYITVTGIIKISIKVGVCVDS